MKTTKVKSVQGSGSFESQYGAKQQDGKLLLFTYDYEFTDGVFMQANHKTVPSPFKVGDTVEYEVTRESEQYGKSGKVSKPQEQFNQTTQSNDGLQGVKIGHAITNAVQIIIHDGTQLCDQCQLEENIKTTAKMILKIGEELNAEISKEAQATPTAPANTQPIQPPFESYIDTDRMLVPLDTDNTKDDIPF